RAMLERWGCRVPLAGGADVALAAAQPGRAPDLVLLDLRLGDTTGPDLMTRLTAAWGTAPPVVLLTADRGDAAQAIAQRHGWRFLPKPVRPPALRALMTQLLLRGGASPTPAP